MAAGTSSSPSRARWRRAQEEEGQNVKTAHNAPAARMFIRRLTALDSAARTPQRCERGNPLTFRDDPRAIAVTASGQILMAANTLPGTFTQPVSPHRVARPQGSGQAPKTAKVENQRRLLKICG